MLDGKDCSTGIGFVFRFKNPEAHPLFQNLTSNVQTIIRNGKESSEVLFKKNARTSWNGFKLDFLYEFDISKAMTTNFTLSLSKRYFGFRGYGQLFFSDFSHFTSLAAGATFRRDKHLKAFVLFKNQFEDSALQTTAGIMFSPSNSTSVQIMSSFPERSINFMLTQKLLDIKASFCASKSFGNSRDFKFGFGLRADF